jgi:pSer/pThr/pTyr-binding forkhead associated (FHA) protein
MPTLKITRGANQGQIITIAQDEYVIGSGIRNDLVLTDSDVSPKHCRFTRVDKLYRLSDLGSKRGTFANGKLVLDEGVMLQHNTVIELGESVAMEYLPGDETQQMATVINLRAKLDFSLPTYYLVIKRSKEQQPEVYSLDMAVITIGRDLGNDIVIPEAKVSRNHLKLERVNKGYILHDLKTSNGTFINKVRIELPTLLQVGDAITIADSIEIWFTDNLETLRY